MWSLLKLVLTIAAGVAGAAAAKRLRLPAPFILGSILGSAAFSLVSGWGFFPADLRVIVQLLSGTVIGSRVSRRDLVYMKGLFWPGVYLIFGMLLFNAAVALVICNLCAMDLITAMFASAPGGVADMALLAPDFGADPTMVTLIQIPRIVAVNTLFPVVYRLIIHHKLYPANWKRAKEANAFAPNRQDEAAAAVTPPATTFDILCLFGVGILGGMLFKFLGIPAGVISGSALAAAAFRIRTGRGDLSPAIRMALQIALGSYIGAQFTMESVLASRTLVWALAAYVLVSLVFSYLLALIIYRISDMDFITSLLVSTPGGVTEMSFIADDFGASVPKVLVMHTLRIFVVIGFFPKMLEILSHFL